MSYFLGIDPSLTATGWAVIKGDRLVASGSIKSKQRGAKRLVEIAKALAEVVDHHQPDGIAIESATFMAFKSASMGEIQGAIKFLFCASGYREPIYIAPTTLKKFVTGNGRGEKSDIKAYILKKWGIMINSNDVADAYGLAKIAQGISEGTANNVKYQVGV